MHAMIIRMHGQMKFGLLLSYECYKEYFSHKMFSDLKNHGNSQKPGTFLNI